MGGHEVPASKNLGLAPMQSNDDETSLFQVVCVCLAGTCAAMYLWLASAKLGLEIKILLVGLVLAATVHPFLQTFSQARGRDALAESKLDRWQRSAFPFLAFGTLLVFLPEFLLGDPSRARIISTLLMVGTVFGVLRMLVSFPQLRTFFGLIESKSSLIAFTLVGLHAIVFIGGIILRHAYFSSEHGDDTAYYNQIFWSTLHGEFFRGSLTQERYFNPPVATEFAIHNSPILFLILPLYSLFPNFYTLLIVRNLALSLSGVPLYLLAKEKLGGAAGLIVMAGYYLSTNIFSQALNGFYPLQFALLFLPLTFLYFFREKFRSFLLCLILTLSVREEIALTTTLFGMYSLFLRRRWQWILVPIVISAAWWWISTEIVMVRSRIAMEELDAFYDMFGGGHNGALATVIENPEKFIALLLSRENFAYLYEVIKPAAWFPFLSVSSIFILPTVAVNCLIGGFMATMRNLSYHYSVVASVCVFVSLIDGISWLMRRMQLSGIDRPILCAGAALLLLPGMAVSLIDNVRLGATQGGFIFPDFLPNPQQETLKKILMLAPSEASIAAPNILLPDLSYRRKLYSVDRLWRYGEEDKSIDYIILNTKLERLGEKDRNKQKYEAVVANTRSDKHYDLVFRENGYEVYQRVATQEREKHAER